MMARPPPPQQDHCRLGAFPILHTWCLQAPCLPPPSASCRWTQLQGDPFPARTPFGPGGHSATPADALFAHRRSASPHWMLPTPAS